MEGGGRAHEKELCAMTNDLVPFEEDADKPRIETLAIAEITLDKEIAARDLGLYVVGEYRERMKAGDEFPPVQVMRDNDGVVWLWDGFHRVEAARWGKLESIRCEIRKGDRRAALLASAGANATHGLRRSVEEKRHAVQKLLADAECAKWSDRQIAVWCKVTHPFVGKVRALLAPLTGNISSEDDGRRGSTETDTATSRK